MSARPLRYTVVGATCALEHFTAIRERLAANGTFVQWLPLYQLRTDDLRTVMRTFLEVFPHARRIHLSNGTIREV